jgi:hypothetical protein
MLLMGAGGSPHVQTGIWDWFLAHQGGWVVLFVILGVSGLLVFYSLGAGLLFSRRQGQVDRNGRSPPLLAETLLCVFARAKDIDALMGDFEELFDRDREAGMSQSRAKVRYWARVLRSTGPQMWQAAKRVGWLGLIAAVMRR